LFIILTLDLLFLSVLSGYFLIRNFSPSTPYDIIDCADSAGRVHKCIRVDPKAGEVSDPAKGASYRVIYGH